MTTHLGHTGLEGHVGTQGGLLEIQGEGEPTQDLRALTRLTQTLELPGPLEQRQQLFTSPIGDGDEVLRHGSRLVSRLALRP